MTWLLDSSMCSIFTGSAATSLRLQNIAVFYVRPKICSNQKNGGVYGEFTRHNAMLLQHRLHVTTSWKLGILKESKMVQNKKVFYKILWSLIKYTNNNDCSNLNDFLFRRTFQRSKQNHSVTCAIKAYKHTPCYLTIDSACHLIMSSWKQSSPSWVIPLKWDHIFWLKA